MKPLAYIVFILFCVSSSFAQEHCVSNPTFRPTELFPGPTCNLVYNDYLVIYTDSIEFDMLKYKISGATVFPFESKDDLLRTFSCNYSFLSASENISGALIKYTIEEEIPRVGDEIQFIYFNDCGEEEQYIYVEDGLYFLRNRPYYLSENVKLLSESSIQNDTFGYSHSIDPNASVVYLEEPLFEYVTEQVLVKAAYTEFEVVAPEYTEAYLYTINEWSDCPDALFDTITQQVLVKEGHLHFDITPAQISVVKELVLIQNDYEGENIYERERIDSINIQMRSPFVEIGNYAVNPGCIESDFYNCIDFDFILNEGRDTTLYNVYEKCADGFKSAGKYCYSNEGNVPRVLEERSYSKLIQDATAVEVQLPNEYMTITSIRILNEDELESSCINAVYDTIPYQKLLTDASLTESMVPAEYGTRVFKNFQDGGIVDVINEGDQEQFIKIPTAKGGTMEIIDFESHLIQHYNPCYLPAIRNRMVELGYLEEAEKDNKLAFQESILNYQIAHGLPLGVLDNYIIDHLDVKFGY